MEMNEEERLINITKEIVDMNDTILGVIGKILSFESNDLILFQNWFEKTTGDKLNICRDVTKIREFCKMYLKDKNIAVPDEPKYEIFQSNAKTSAEFMKEWNSDDFGSGRVKR